MIEVDRVDVVEIDEVLDLDRAGLLRVELLELESIGDRILARVRWTMRGEASGAPLQVDVALVCEARDDRLTKMAYFLDREAARAESKK